MAPGEVRDAPQDRDRDEDRREQQEPRPPAESCEEHIDLPCSDRSNLHQALADTPLVLGEECAAELREVDRPVLENPQNRFSVGDRKGQDPCLALVPVLELLGGVVEALVSSVQTFTSGNESGRSASPDEVHDQGQDRNDDAGVQKEPGQPAVSSDDHPSRVQALGLGRTLALLECFALTSPISAPEIEAGEDDRVGRGSEKARAATIGQRAWS